MPPRTIQPDDDLRILFPAASKGRHVRVRVESEKSVNAYLVDRDGLDDFDDGNDFMIFAGEDQSERVHKLSAFIPRGKTWYLLIVNQHDDPVAVYWNAYVRP